MIDLSAVRIKFDAYDNFFIACTRKIITIYIAENV